MRLISHADVDYGWVHRWAFNGMWFVRVDEWKGQRGVASMDADRRLIVMDSPAPLGIPFVRKEAA